MGRAMSENIKDRNTLIVPMPPLKLFGILEPKIPFIMKPSKGRPKIMDNVFINLLNYLRN
jgi:hypothetical protein